MQKRPAYTLRDDGERRARGPATSWRSRSAAGLPVTWVDTPELPFGTRGAVMLPDQAQLDPMELLAAIAADLSVPWRAPS